MSWQSRQAMIPDVAAGNPIQQGPPVAPGSVRTGAWSRGPPGDDPGLPARFKKIKLKQ
jgi:hypothetical protein